jgi:anaerobic selenocysteine-containing dehydrogenase
LAGKYPLIVTTRRVPYYFLGEHRMIPWLRELEPDPILEMHPDTARARDLRDGDWAAIETRRGRIRMRVRVTPGIHPRVVRCPHGWWFPEKSAADGLHGAWESNFNVITRNDRGQGFDPMWGCPQLRGLMCQVSRE